MLRYQVMKQMIYTTSAGYASTRFYLLSKTGSIASVRQLVLRRSQIVLVRD